MFREIAEASKLQCNFLIKGTYVITDFNRMWYKFNAKVNQVRNTYLTTYIIPWSAKLTGIFRNIFFILYHMFSRV